MRLSLGSILSTALLVGCSAAPTELSPAHRTPAASTSSPAPLEPSAIEQANDSTAVAELISAVGEPAREYFLLESALAENQFIEMRSTDPAIQALIDKVERTRRSRNTIRRQPPLLPFAYPVEDGGE